MKLCPKCQKHFSDDANFCPVDAARLVPLETAPEAVAADPLAARYDLGEALGGNRTGVVHRATDKASGQAVAIKLIAPTVVALPGLAQRLERELKQLERVQSGGVARVLGSGKRGDDSWVALELLDSVQTLGEAVEALGAMPADKAARLVGVIGEALIEAAQVGVVHRDLAPKNIVFAGDDVKLINFSLPVPAGDKVPGVAEFVAPEQHEGKPVDQRSNLYSLGALYYFLLTARPVQLDDTGAVVLPSSLADVPEPVEGLILRALDKSPTRRFLTVRQFIDEVGRVARGEPGVRSTQPMARASKPKAELVQTLVDAQPAGQAAVPAGGTIIGVGIAAGSDRSPWAPPASSSAPTEPVPAAPPAAAIAATAPVAAIPATSAPVATAPVAPVPLPVLAGPPRKPGKTGDAKSKFRETMWFKKGELDAQAAQAAAEEHARTGKVTSDKADQLPLDERYKDDGSLSHSDKDKYSLRTGATQSSKAIRDSGSHAGSGTSAAPGAKVSKVSEDELIGEMKGGRNKVIAILAVALAVLAVIVFLIVR